jgi:hypothetical protein
MKRMGFMAIEERPIEPYLTQGEIMRKLLKLFYVVAVMVLAGLVMGCSLPAHGQGGCPLWQAANDGDLNAVRSCVEHGASVDTPAKPGAEGERGFTPLVIAARNGHLEVVEYLVEHGANINNAANGRDKSALLAASYGRHLDVVEYLLNKGANINAQAFNGYTPLNDAASIGDFQVVKYLVDHGADPRIRDKKGLTPAQNAQLRLERYPHLKATNWGRGTPDDFRQIISYLQAHGG